MAEGSRSGGFERPSLLAVDDDPAVLRAVQRDLRSRYGENYRVLRADSGSAALDLMHQLKLRGSPLALALADQRMPGMSGVELLEEARSLFPSSKRVLLTAYADTEAAIKAINDVDLDYYLLKPWDPPEEQLFPVIDDLLADWTSSGGTAEYAVRIVGHRFSREAHELRDFLTRNQVPFTWLDVERDREAQQLLEVADVDAERLPVLVFSDGGLLERPSPLEVAEKVGLTTRAELPFYDLVIIGGGPAGLAAAVYGASEGLRTVMVEREAPGGQAGQSSRIENYLGFPSGLSGSDLARRATAQARRLGAEIISVNGVDGIERRGPARVLRLGDGTELSCHAVLVATGVAYRRLEAPGVEELTGRGVYYGAAVAEAVSCTDQRVVVVGGANSAGQAAMYFARYAAQVTVLYRGDALEKSMSRYLIDQVMAQDNIEVRLQSSVAAAHGAEQLTEITVAGPYGETRERADAMFVFIGADPHTDWLGGVVERDERGFLLAGPDVASNGSRPRGWDVDRDPFLLETSVPGIFVAGDVRHRSIKRVASAVGEGSMAVQFIHRYLADT
jgi:thioredoxin reductase (NADPH)